MHVLRASLGSLLTISGLQIGYLLGGVVFVEVIFAWPGIGELVYQSIAARDFAVIQAGVLLAALGFVLINVSWTCSVRLSTRGYAGQGFSVE